MYAYVSLYTHTHTHTHIKYLGTCAYHVVIIPPSRIVLSSCGTIKYTQISGALLLE